MIDAVKRPVKITAAIQRLINPPNH
ncbi:uncharacterized protein METZ01_LOCUS407446, partial [marine metagenome]